MAVFSAIFRCTGTRNACLRVASLSVTNQSWLPLTASKKPNNQLTCATNAEQSYTRDFQTSAVLGRGQLREPKKWSKYNDIVYPPQKEGEPVRPAEINHHWQMIKYSQKKLWYIGLMIRGMSIDEAIKQLSFYPRKGAHIVKDLLLEAQEIAVRDHNVEFKSNLWIADAYATKAKTIKGLRMHARRMRPGIIHYRYSHFFVRLREGRPPKQYYTPEMTGHQKVEDYIQRLRDRRIFSEL